MVKCTVLAMAAAGHYAEYQGQVLALRRVAGLTPLARALAATSHLGIERCRLILADDHPANGKLQAQAAQSWRGEHEPQTVTVDPAASELEALAAALEPDDEWLLVVAADQACDPQLFKLLWQEATGSDPGQTPAGLAVVVAAGGGAGDDGLELEPGRHFAGLALVPAGLVRNHTGPGDLQGWLRGLLDAGRLRLVDGRGHFSMRLRRPGDVSRAARRQVQALRRSSDGIVSRWLNRPVSLWLSRWLFANLPLTPNHITFLAAAIGWAGIALVFAWPGYWWVLAGAGLFHLSSILDGCDGEVARLRFQFSRFGEWFDNVLDEVNNALFIGAIGVGLWRHGGGDIYLAAALFHVFTVALVDSATFYQLVKFSGGSGSIDNMRWFFQKAGQSGPDTSSGGLGQWAMQLVRRDFYILLLLVLAAADVLHWGLWLSVSVDCVLVVLASIQWWWQLSSRGRRRLSQERS